jgi:hypothetical protein
MNTQRDRLEQFILDHREAFDSATPRSGIWNAIERTLEADGLEQFVRQNRDAFDVAAPSANSWAAIEEQMGANDDFEAFVLEHRDAFNAAAPSRQVWHQIDKTLHPEHHVRKLGFVSAMRVLRVAASVLLLLAAGAIAGIYFTQSQQTQQNAVASLSDISPEYAEMVRYYNNEIDEKVRQVALYSEDEGLLQDLEAIDRTMAELERELQNVPPGAEEQVISNLIKSYQTKVEILERVLSRIQQSEDSEKNNSEDDEISI